MYSPLNSYVYIHWILDFKYILLLYKLLVYINLGQFCIFLNVSYNIIILLSVLKNLLVTGIPILILYTCTYSGYLLHEICYPGVTCIMQYISKSKLLRSGFICVLFTISVKFVIHFLPTCIFGLIGVLTFCLVKHFVGIHCYSYTVVCLYMYIDLIYCDIIKYFRPTITLSDWIYYIYIMFATLRCILLFKFL